MYNPETIINKNINILSQQVALTSTFKTELLIIRGRMCY